MIKAFKESQCFLKHAAKRGGTLKAARGVTAGTCVPEDDDDEQEEGDRPRAFPVVTSTAEMDFDGVYIRQQPELSLDDDQFGSKQKDLVELSSKISLIEEASGETPN